MYKGTHEITYYDLDLMGRVKLSALLRMVHIAADINAKDLGIGYKELSAHNMTFVLQRFAIVSARMPVYGETVKIRTWPDSVSRGTFMRKGDMFDENGKKIMEWASLWILFDIEERKILKPSALPATLPTEENYGVDIVPEKIILPSEYGAEYSRYTHTARYADVDTNKHINNSIYGDLIGNALSSQNWREIHINYLSEIRENEKVDVIAYSEKNCLGNNSVENNYFLVIGKTPARISFSARVDLY